MSDVKLYKLVSGEEVLAKQVSDGSLSFSGDATSIILEDAVTLVYQQTEKGQMSVGFAPFMPYADGSITLYTTSIASVAEPKQQIRNEYTRIFTGIVVASPGSI